MPLSPNEIRDRALHLARDWAGGANNNVETQSFRNAFFHMFGVDRKCVASVAQTAARSSGSGHGPATGAQRATSLFDCYQALTRLLPADKPKQAPKRKEA